MPGCLGKPGGTLQALSWHHAPGTVEYPVREAASPTSSAKLLQDFELVNKDAVLIPQHRKESGDAARAKPGCNGSWGAWKILWAHGLGMRLSRVL